MMGTVSFEVPGPRTYQVTCDPKLNPLANGGSAGDILTGKQFYNDQNQVVTGTLVPAAPTYAGVLVVTVDAGAEVTVTDGTTTLTATSTGTATFHLPNGGTWTVSAALNGSQSSPATVEVQENFSLALSAGASQTVTVPTQYEAELSFVPTYTVSVTIDPAGSGTVTGAAQYQEGAAVTLTATVNDGYTFNGWKENGALVSTDNPYVFTATADRAFVAAFAEKPASRLPDGYTEVEYIHWDGNATRFVIPSVNGNTDRIVYKIYPESCGTSSSTQHMIILQTVVSDIGYSMSLVSRDSSTLSYLLNKKNGAYNTATIDVVDNLLTFDIDYYNNRYTVNEISLSGTKYARILGNSPYSRYLGGSKSVIGKFYGYTQYRNEVIIHDYVPCVNPDGIAGIFDLIDSNFVANTHSNATSITPGPAI